MSIATPCTRICTLHPATGLCLGCGRTGAEIAAWGGLTPGERAAVMAELPGRLGGSGAQSEAGIGEARDVAS